MCLPYRLAAQGERILLIALVLVAAGCNPRTNRSSSLQLPDLDLHIPVTDRPLQNDPDDFQFVIVADRTGGHRPGVFAEAAAKVNLLRPEFVVSIGDLIEGYTEDDQLIHAQWDEFDQLADGFESPFFYLPGNHDFTNKVMADIWEQRYGRSYYHFVYRDVLFLCLNTEDGGLGHLAQRQIDYAQKVLSDHAGARWTVVLMHEPIWHSGYGDPHPEWKQIEQALGEREFTVFAGHWHAYRRHEFKDRRYYILATTGGGSRMRGTPFGEFDHVMWVTMTDDGPRIANLELAGILEEDVMTSEVYNRVYELSDAYSVSMSPVVREAGPFERAEMNLRIENRADLPLRLTGGFGPAGPLHIHPHAVDIEVGPDQTELVPIELSSAQEQMPANLPPARFEGQASFLRPGPEGPLEFPVRTATAIYSPTPVEQTEAAPVIDGALGDWAALPYAVGETYGQLVDAHNTWRGPSDCSYRFGIRHDGDSLYLAVRVIDEAPIADAAGLPWDQDGIEIRLDPRDDPQRSNNVGTESQYNRAFVFLALSVDRDGNPISIYRPEALPPGIEWASTRDAQGYSLEVRFSGETLRAMRGDEESVDMIRMNLAVNDVDEIGGRRAQLWWKSDWRGSLNIPGAGTFSLVVRAPLANP